MAAADQFARAQIDVRPAADVGVVVDRRRRARLAARVGRPADAHRWILRVTGRNGVKVDEEVFKKDAVMTLHSGSVIEIAGVQMMFVLPDRTARVAPGFLQRAKLRSYVVDEDVPVAQTLFAEELAGARKKAPGKAGAGKLAADRVAGASQANDRRGSVIPVAAIPAQKGVVLELSEDVDYSLDRMKEVKPPYSYALLIAQAILSSETEQLTLSAIYTFIMDNYSFYRHSNMGWQVSAARLDPAGPCVRLMRDRTRSDITCRSTRPSARFHGA